VENLFTARDFFWSESEEPSIERSYIFQEAFEETRVLKVNAPTVSLNELAR